MPGAHRRDRTPQDRSKSMSAASTAHIRAALLDQAASPSPSSRTGRPSLPPLPAPSPRPGATPPSTPGRRTPIVYPALLSRVAEAFRARIALAERVKDGLAYKDAFDGRQAVDKIAYIIKTTDRNLALLLGRALDAQKFFHAVTYDHRLRDSPADVYQFKTRVPSPFASGDIPGAHARAAGKLVPPARPDSAFTQESGSSPSHDPSSTESPSPGDPERGERDPDPDPERDDSSPTPPPAPGARHARAGSVGADDAAPLPTGVFTLLTDCYSPTCSRDRLCYSITCPRRLEQQARLHMKPQPGLLLKKAPSRESLGELELVEPGLLWVHSVPQEVVNSVSDAEKRRQEAINEVIYTERDFVRDMEYLRDVSPRALALTD